MDVNACDKCGKTAPLQILNTHRFGICVGCGFPIVRGDEFDNARLEAVQGDECHLNLPERIHTKPYDDNAWIHDQCEKMGITFAELMEQQRWPWSLPNRPDFKDAGIAYPKGYDKNGPFFQFKSKPPPEGYHFQNVFPTLPEGINRITLWGEGMGSPSSFPHIKRSGVEKVTFDEDWLALNDTI